MRPTRLAALRIWADVVRLAKAFGYFGLSGSHHCRACRVFVVVGWGLKTSVGFCIMSGPVGEELLSGLDSPVGESGLSGACTTCRVLGAVGQDAIIIIKCPSKLVDGVTQKMRVKKHRVATAHGQPDSANPTGLPIGPQVCSACRGCRGCRARRARQLSTGQSKKRGRSRTTGATVKTTTWAVMRFDLVVFCNIHVKTFSPPQYYFGVISPDWVRFLTRHLSPC